MQGWKGYCHFITPDLSQNHNPSYWCWCGIMCWSLFTRRKMVELFWGMWRLQEMSGVHALSIQRVKNRFLVQVASRLALLSKPSSSCLNKPKPARHDLVTVKAFSVLLTSAGKIPAFSFLQWNIMWSALKEKVFKLPFANEIGKIRILLDGIFKNTFII